MTEHHQHHHPHGHAHPPAVIGPSILRLSVIERAVIAAALIVLVWGAVHRAHHRKGIGELLTRYRLDHFRERHPMLDMTIDTSHHTAPFYERFGFRTEKFTEDGYAKGLHRHDMRLMG